MIDPARSDAAPADPAKIPGKLWSVVTYLEMTEPTADARTPPALPTGTLLHMADGITVDRYRDLYRAVGERWLWYERLLVPDDQLAAEIAGPGVEVRVLEVDGELAGYSELDRRTDHEVEIAYFGLTPNWIGSGRGRTLMAHTLAAAWSSKPRRVWLHTCTEDHPHALRFYRRMGFEPYASEAGWIDDPRVAGILPNDSAPHIPIADRP